MRLLARPARSALKASSYYAGGLFKRLTSDPVFLWAQAIAFKVLVTLLPLVLLATGIFGLVLRQENPFEAVSGFIRSFLPAAQSGQVIELVFQLQRSSGALTFVGAAAFLFTVITLFTTLRYVIGQAMGVTRHQVRSLLGGYAFDLRMLVQVGTLFLLSFGVTFGAKLLYARSGAFATEIGMDPVLVRQIGSEAVRLIVLTVPYLLTFGMMAQLYYFIPRPHPPKRSAMLGAAVAAVLFELAKNGFAVYATTIGNFSRYDESNDALNGVFGLILALVLWVYLSGLVLVIGAFVTRLHEHWVAPRRQSAVRRLWKRMGADRRRARLIAQGVESSTAAPEAAGDGLAGPALAPSPTPAPVGSESASNTGASD